MSDSGPAPDATADESAEFTGNVPQNRRTVAGVEVVTIPVREYAHLLDCRRRLAELGVRRARFEVASKSRIERDPEVATFIAESLGTKTGDQIRAACLERFGAERTPSRSAINRFWHRLRQAGA